MSNFQTYSQYYDLLYKDKNYGVESAYVLSKIKTYSPQAKTILELGSGSASHASYFCSDKYIVSGIERSQEMINQAVSKKIKGFTPILGDIVTTKINQKFDVVISLFHVISYLTDNDSLLQCFQNTYNHLEENGIFLFDIWYTPAVYHQKPETRIKRLENPNIQITRIAQPELDYNRNVVTVNFEVFIKDKKTNELQVLNENHPMRHFSIPEIELVAKLSNFEIIKVEEFLTENIASENTWGVCFILKKIVL